MLACIVSFVGPATQFLGSTEAEAEATPGADNNIAPELVVAGTTQLLHEPGKDDWLRAEVLHVLWEKRLLAHAHRISALADAVPEVRLPAPGSCHRHSPPSYLNILWTRPPRPALLPARLLELPPPRGSGSTCYEHFTKISAESDHKSCNVLDTVRISVRR